MTPMQIHWCIMFWVRADPIVELGDEHFNSPAGKDVLQWMIDEKLIEWSADKNRYVALERLGVFVAHLCEQPLPVQKWVIPATEGKQQ